MQDSVLEFQPLIDLLPSPGNAIEERPWNSTDGSGNLGPYDPLLENLNGTNFNFRLKSDYILFFNM